MADERKFKEGDVVYHKATEQKGVLVEIMKRNSQKWKIIWEDKQESFHKEIELYTKKEHDDEYGIKISSI